MKHRYNKKAMQVNQVKIEFTNKPITAWGGTATIIAKFLETIGFKYWVEEEIPVIESSNNSRGKYSKVLAQFLTALSGGTRFGHLTWWGHGLEAIKKAFGVKWLPTTPSVLTRFWNNVSTQGIAERLGESVREFASKIVEVEGIHEDNLNLDSSVFTRYGSQEGAKKGYNPKKRGRPSHHPLLAFLGSGYVINLWNRSGNTAAGSGAIDFFRQTIIALGEKFCVKRVLCDSGFYDIKFIKDLESEGITYIIAAPMWEILQEEIYMVTHWKGIENGIEVGEIGFKHKDPKWDRFRRYIIVRQSVQVRPKATGRQLSLFKELEDVKDYRYIVFITNDKELPPEEVWRHYRPRSNDENVIKELQDGYGISSFNLDNFWATEAVMLMNALVFHNLFHYLNRNILNRNKVKQQLKTLRFKYLIIPAFLGSSSRKQILRLAVHDRSLRSKFRYFLERINDLPWNLNCIAFKT